MTHTLAAPLAAYLLTGGMLFLILHWVRRVLWKPALKSGVEGAETPGPPTRAFGRVQRFFHWTSTLALALIVFSGLSLYSPAFFDPLTHVIGFSIHSNILLLVDLHVASVVVLGALLVLHVGWDFYRLKTWPFISNGNKDLSELLSRVRGFFSGGAVAWSEKYDVFMRSFHTMLIALFLGLGFTGLVMYFVAPWWLYPQLLHSAIEPWWMPTPIHDILGFSFIVMAVAHTYFALLGTNRSILKAMVTGQAAPLSAIQGTVKLEDAQTETQTSPR
jgi:cytochrome b subunit of formate dehydrogenase